MTIWEFLSAHAFIGPTFLATVVFWTGFWLYAIAAPWAEAFQTKWAHRPTDCARDCECVAEEAEDEVTSG